MIAIIDYDAGNLRSVEKALAALGETPVITRRPEEILAADKVILPGVGSFGDAMEKLRQYDLVEVIRRVAEQGTPFLGICLGLQLLFESSEETPGRGRPGASARAGFCKIPDSPGPEGASYGLEFPGNPPGCQTLFPGIDNGAYVYFVHSYYLKAADPSIVAASTWYSTDIHASVERGNVFACQFHPEKSGEVGLAILKNFINL